MVKIKLERKTMRELIDEVLEGHDVHVTTITYSRDKIIIEFEQSTISVDVVKAIENAFPEFKRVRGET